MQETGAAQRLRGVAPRGDRGTLVPSSSVKADPAFLLAGTGCRGRMATWITSNADLVSRTMNLMRIPTLLRQRGRELTGTAVLVVMVGCSAAKPAATSTETSPRSPVAVAPETPTPAAAAPASTDSAVAAAPPVAPAESAPAVTSPAALADPEKQLPELEGFGWRSLFDGRSLEGWQVTDFAGHGDVEVEGGRMVLRMGAMLTGVNLLATNDLATTNYELVLDAMKLEGSDFFCALTFPVGDTCCSFLLGGWGGGVVGISSIDGNDASLNETTKYVDFERDRWYRVRIRVTPRKLEAWIGAKQMVDVLLEGRRLTVRPGEIELSQPWGIASWQTTGALRNIHYRDL